MSTMRTPEERFRIAQECVRIEKEGGDILAYLWNENYLTPRATWYNIQREFLGRKRYEFTEGKPNERKMRKMKLKLTPEKRQKAIQIAIDGGDPLDYLAREVGMRAPVKAWHKIRIQLKDEDPETFAKLPNRLPNSGYRYHRNDDLFPGRKPAVDKGMPKTGEPDKVLGKPKEDFEKLELEGGKNYQVSVAEKPEQEVTVSITQDAEGIHARKITKPVNFGGFEVSAIRVPDLGEFYYDHQHDSIDWRTIGGDEVSMGPEFWRLLHEKLPDIMGVLGVQV